MSSLEIISIRLYGLQIADFVLKRLKETFGQKASEEYRVKLYRNTTVETDICIHIYQGRETHERSKSTVGIQIANMLRDFGSVNHSVWQEEVYGP